MALSVCIAVFVGFYLFYLVVCVRYAESKPRKRFSPRPTSPPTISIIIPTYNEERVVRRRIENLVDLHYPRVRLEIVFVDGGSTDRTVEVIENQVKESDLSIKVIRQGRRKGFNMAIIEGFDETTGEIICVTGAEAEYHPDALNAMVACFESDPKIGAVTGRQEIKNIEDGYSPRLEVSYRSLYDLVRSAESAIDSPFDVKGEISASKRSVFAHLVERRELREKGAIDTCISFQAKLDGYRTVYEPSAVYYELSPKSIQDSFKQQARRAATLIENMLAFKCMIFRNKFGAFGMLIMPAHVLMLTVLPFVFLVASVGTILMAALNPWNFPILSLVALGLLVTALSSRVQAFVKTQMALLVATLGTFFGIETQKFERLESTRA